MILAPKRKMLERRKTEYLIPSISVESCLSTALC